MVFYFTGTGNSRYIAEIISKRLDDDIVSLNEKIKQNDYSEIHSDRPIVFVFPIYAWQMPHIVRDFIKKVKFSGTKKVYFIATCGAESGNAVHFIKNLCYEKHLHFMGIMTIKMPENYIALFSTPSKEKAAEIVSAAKPKAVKAAGYILTERSLPCEKLIFIDIAKSSFINKFFYNHIISDEKFFSKDSCIGCGKCVQVCPTNNITLENNRPVWNGNCTHCMACISFCPVEAIEYGKTTEKKRRYYIKDGEIH